MNKTKIAINLILATIVGTGIWFAMHKRPTAPEAPVAVVSVPEQLTAFSLKDTDGVARNSSEWASKILIVNYWATWCPPCLEEMPTLVDFQTQYSPKNIQVVGIAVDNLEQVKDFMDTYGINFPVLIGGDDAIQLSQKMGNRISALPFTAIFDQNGKTIYAQPGKITHESLEKVIKPLL